MSPDNENKATLDFDVVVVGCGIAGLSAAVAALEQGARVAILERSTIEERGGQTRWTEAQMRMKSEQEVADDFESHFAENAGHYLDPELVSEAAGDYENWSSIVKVLNFTDPELISTISDGAGPTLQWLKGFGVRFDFQPSYFITTCTTRISPVGGGLALIEALAGTAERKGATFFYRTTARSLVTDDTGRVCGLVAACEKSRTLRFRAKSVVLGSGGFQGNAEMLTQYLGPKARYLRPVARGGYYNKGEGIRMALAAGAATAGDYGQLHAEPLDPRSGAPEPIVLVFNYGILVNKRGERFVDEAPSTVDATYESITRRILEEPEGIAWSVLDAGIADVPNWKKSVRSDQPPISAPTLTALAKKIGVPADALERTVAEFNAACGEGRFDPLATDGLRTAPGYAPPKSNWARPVAQGPFLAYPLICGNCFTFGGIRVNKRSEVVNTDGEAIPGLYAAGEMTGLYYGTYTGATSVLRGAVFGRIAGQQAASS
jgi:tricarballylate dehydrogenase